MRQDTHTYVIVIPRWRLESLFSFLSLWPNGLENVLTKVGKFIIPADFVVLNHDMTVSETYLNGESRYKA